MKVTIGKYFYAILLIINASMFAAERKLVIGEASGLFSCFFVALNSIVWCDKNNVKPVIYWGPQCKYYEDGYDKTNNAWEYYFEPVSSAKYEPGDQIWKNNKAIDGYTTSLLTRRHRRTNKDMRMHRRKINAYIKKYIKLKPSLQEKIDDFYQKNIAGKKTIAIHVRGTDKYLENRPFNPSLIFAQANRIAAQYPNCQFLVATDEQAILEKAKKELHRKVIHYDAYRSPSGTPLHYNNSYNKAKQGEEVIIEAYLLAKCDIFLHTISAVSSAVLFLNPESREFLFDHNRWYDGAKMHYYR